MWMIQDLDYPHIVRSICPYLFLPPCARTAVRLFSPNMFNRLHVGQTWDHGSGVATVVVS